MPPESASTLERPSIDSDPATGHALVRVPTTHVRIGMFIAELDRPWLGSPFLIQGFAIEDEEQLSTLRSVCAHVDIDPSQSLPDAAVEIRSLLDSGTVKVVGAASVSAADSAQHLAEVADRAARAGGRLNSTTRTGQVPVELKPRADIQIQRKTRRRFDAFVSAPAQPETEGAARPAPAGSALGRFSGWLRTVVGDLARRSGLPLAADSVSKSTPVHKATIREVLQAELPPGAELTRYRRRHSVASELPRARIAVSRGQSVLQQVISDIRSGRAPDVEQVSNVVDDMVVSMIDNPDAMLWMARLRDENVGTYNHAIKVAIYLITLGRHLGFPPGELSNLGLIGMLADVGKLMLPRAVIDKPGVLSEAEFACVKEHVALGLEALRKAGPLPASVELGIAQHHERLDGSGYPGSLPGQEISIYGRMAGIADSYAALTTARVYANALSPQDALLSLYEVAGKTLQEALVEQFVQAIGVFPVSSLVELSSGEVAIVVSHNRVRRLEPRVLVLTGTDKAPLAQPRDVDLLAQRRGSGSPLRIVRGLPVGAFGLKLREYYVADSPRRQAVPA